ncbi:MAG: NAD(P)-dependent oxidoreductase [Hamadaea sp.]|uniref:NAD(P)-dependent oxidoreductase n=1 Tax=Hamadaea sp. TaxID=2024425 RepID=UPI0018189319|nr:NAD(P)-dependent oxidoreductase [Hamadaea sp.]NUT19782.1 NAD(P)-dependent oxidoreductase [Hamadaea sp.]
MRFIWFGLGRFGLPMAKNLIDRGHDILVPTNGAHGAAAAREALAWGARPTEPATAVDGWLTCLPRPEDVREVLASIDRSQTSLVVDFSTGHPTGARDIASWLHDRDIRYVDSPVSGSPAQAAEGSLTTWAGAPEPERGSVIRGLLEDVAANIFYMGTVGTGSAMKLVNQVVHITNIAALGDGLALARALGVDEQLAVASMQTSSADSAMLRRFGPAIVAHDFSPRFALKLASKDVRFATAEAAQHDVQLDLLRLVADRLMKLEAEGYGESDFSVLASSLAQEA